MTTERAEERISRAVNHLCSMPAVAHVMLTRAELRAVLQRTGGDVMACGHLYDIVSESRGAGMYTVRLKRREYT